MKPITARAALPLLAVLASLGLTACSSDSSDSIETFTVEQAAPRLVEFGPSGVSGGKEYELAFEAKITRDGSPAGRLLGLLTTVDAAPPATNGGRTLESRFGSLYFDFSRSDSVVVSGATVYPARRAEMEANRPQVRAIVGGTGKYLGAGGQVTTTRQADGTYTHEFALKS